MATLLVLCGVTAGLIVSLDSASANGRDLATARFPGFQLAFRYPRIWRRVDWCWSSANVSPVTLLTTADPTPRCMANLPLGVETPFPPPQRLGSDGVSAAWFSTDRRALVGARPNAHVGGEPARITVRPQSARGGADSFVGCVGRGGAGQRLVSAQIRGPSSDVPQIRLEAVICGPDPAGGEADVRQMLASVRFIR